MKTITEVAWHNRKYYPASGRIQPSRQSLTSSVDDLDSSMSTDRRSRANSPTWTTWASMSSNSVLRHLRHHADNTSNHLELLDLENSGKQQDNITSKRDGGNNFGSLPKGQTRNATDSPIFGVGETLPILDIQDSATTVMSDVEKYPDISLSRRKKSGKKENPKSRDSVMKSSGLVSEQACSELQRGSHLQLRCSPPKIRPSYEVESDGSSSVDVGVTWKKSDIGKSKFNAQDLAPSDSCSTSSVGSFENTGQRLPKENLESKTPFMPGVSNERARGKRVRSRENRQSESDTGYHIAKNEAEKSSQSRLNYNKNREEEESVTQIFIDHYDIKHKLAPETKCPAASGERLSQNNSDFRERSQHNFNDDGMRSGARDNQCLTRHEEKAKQASQSKRCGSAFRTALSFYDARQRQKQCSPSNSSVDSDHLDRRKLVAPRLKGLGGEKSGIRMLPLHVAKKQPLILPEEKLATAVSNCKLEPGETVENDLEKCASGNSSCMTPDSLLLRSQSSNTITSSASQPLHRTAVNNQVRNCIRALISAESPLQSTAKPFCPGAHTRKEPSFFNCAESNVSDTIKNDEDPSTINSAHEVSKQKDTKLSFLAYLMDDGYLAQKGRETISKSTTSAANDAAIENVPSPKEPRARDRTSSVPESRKVLRRTKYKKPERRLRGILSVEKITPTQKLPGKPKTCDTESIHKSETGLQRLGKDCDNLVGWTFLEGQGRHQEAGPSTPCTDFLNPAETCSSHNVTVVAFDVPDVTDFACEAAIHQTDSHELFFDNGTDDDILNSFSVSQLKTGEQNSASETMFGVNSFDSSTVSNSLSDSTSSNEESTTRPQNKHSFGAFNVFTAKKARRAKRNTEKATTSSGRAGVNAKDHIGAYQTSSAYSRALIQSAFASNMFSKNTFGYSSYKAPVSISCTLLDSSNAVPAVQEIRNLKDAFNVCSGMLLSSSKTAPDHGFEPAPPDEPCPNQSVITPVTFSSYLEKLNMDTPASAMIPQFARDESGARCTPKKKDTHYVCTPSPRPLLTISAIGHVSPGCQSFRSKRFPKRPYYFSVHSNASKAKHQHEKVDSLARSTLSDHVNNTMSTATDECRFGQMRDKFQSGCTMVRPRPGRLKWKPLSRPYGSVCNRRRTFTERFNRPSLAEQALVTNSLYREYACYGGDLPRKNVSTRGLASHRLFPSGSIWRKSRLKHFPSCPIGLQARRKMDGYKKCLKKAHETEHLKKCEPQQGHVQRCKGGPLTDTRQVKVAQAGNGRGENQPKRNPIYEKSLKRCTKRLAEMRNANKDPKNIPLPPENNATTSVTTHKNPKPGKNVGFAGLPKSTGKSNGKKCLRPAQKKDGQSPRAQSDGDVKSKNVDVFSRLYPNSTPGRCIRSTRSVCSELVQALKTDSSCPGSFVKEDVQRLWRMDKDVERIETSKKGVVAATSLEKSDKNTVNKIGQGKDGAAPGITEDIFAHRRMIECIKLVLKKQSEALDAINDSLNIMEWQPDAGEDGKCPQKAPDVSNCNRETVDLTTATKSEITSSTSGLMKSSTSNGRLTKDPNNTTWGARKEIVTLENRAKVSAVSSSINQDGARTQTLLLPPRRLAPLPPTPGSANVHASLPRLTGRKQCNIEPCLLGDFSFQGKLKSQFSISSKVSQSIPPSTAPNGTISAHENEKLPVDDGRSELVCVQFYPSPYALSSKGSRDKNTLERTDQCSRPNSCRPKQNDAQTDSKNQPQKKLQSSHNSEGNMLGTGNCGKLRSSKSFLEHKHNKQGNVKLPVLANPHQNNNSSLQKPTTCQTCITTTAEQGVKEKRQDSEHACNAICPCLELCLKKFVTPYLDENLGPQNKGLARNMEQMDSLNEIQTQIQNLVKSIHSHNKCSCSQTLKHNQEAAPRHQSSKGETQCFGTVNARLLSSPEDHSMTQVSSSGHLCCHSNNEAVVMNNQSQASKTFSMNGKQTSGLSVTTELAREIDLELALYQEVSKTNEGCTAEPNQDVYVAQRLEIGEEMGEQPGTSITCGESDVLEKNETTLWIQPKDVNHGLGENSQAMVTRSFHYSHSLENSDIPGDISTSEQLSETVQSESISTCHCYDRSADAVCDRSQQVSLTFYQSQSVESVHTGGDIFGPIEQIGGETCEIISQEPSFISQTSSARNDHFPQPPLATDTDRMEKSGRKEDLNTVTTKPPPVQKQRFAIRSWFLKPGSLIKNLKRSDNKKPKPKIEKDNSSKESQSVGKSTKRFGRSVLGSPNKSQGKLCSTTATVEKTNTAPMHPKQRPEVAVSSNKDANKQNSTHQNRAKEIDKNNSNFPSKCPANQSVTNLTVAPMTSDISTESQAQSPTIAFSEMIPTHTRRVLSVDEVGDVLKVLMNEVEFQGPKSVQGNKERIDVEVEGSRDNSKNWTCANGEEIFIENTAQAEDELTAMEIMIQQNKNTRDGVQPITGTTLCGFEKQVSEKHCDCLVNSSAGDEDITRNGQVVITDTQRSRLNEPAERLPAEEWLNTQNVDDSASNQSTEGRSEQSDMVKEQSSDTETAEVPIVKVFHPPTTSRPTSRRGETPIDRGSCSNSGDSWVREGSSGEDSASRDECQADESSSASNPKAPLMVCKVNPFVNNAQPYPNVDRCEDDHLTPFVQ